MDDSTSQMMSFLQNLLIVEVLYFRFIVLFDNFPLIEKKIPIAGLCPCTLAELSMVAFMLLRPAEGQSWSLSLVKGFL